MAFWWANKYEYCSHCSDVYVCRSRYGHSLLEYCFTRQVQISRLVESIPCGECISSSVWLWCVSIVYCNFCFFGADDSIYLSLTAFCGMNLIGLDIVGIFCCDASLVWQPKSRERNRFCVFKSQIGLYLVFILWLHVCKYRCVRSCRLYARTLAVTTTCRNIWHSGTKTVSV